MLWECRTSRLVAPSRLHSHDNSVTAGRQDMRVFVPISVGGWVRLFSRWDILAVLLILGLLVFLGEASRHLFEPLADLQRTPPSLDPANLPEYAARTTLRMLVAMALSLLVHLHLCDAGGEEQAGRTHPRSAARYPAIGADPGLHLGHRRVLHGARSRARAGRRIRGDLRDFHQPGLEHGVQLLPVAAHGADRARSRRRAISGSARGCRSGASTCRSPCRS